MTRPSWPKVEELYHAALEKQPAERESFLAEACGRDDELRNEVQSLLNYEREADRLMERPAASAATQKLAVTRGTRLGPYEVIDLLGAGGMGEVYRARDTRLGRDVAIKVLPEHVAHDAAALARFDREARAVAALSHPHIEALFDIGETDGTHYLVMELLEGETLAARLRRGALPEKDALRIGAEIAEALGAAHGHGVIHRDVKPANVMLTRSGVKLLDFGLARLQWRPGPSGETVTTTGLGEGVMAGTLPYMAPEQLEGREADARTDIWALGCVLFEMLTGRRAFDGDSQARVIAAIEKNETPLRAGGRPSISDALQRLVGQCLKKDPADRWQSAYDVALRLKEIATEEPGTEPQRPGRRLSQWRVPALGAALLLAALSAVVAGRWWRGTPRPGAGGAIVHASIDLPSGIRLTQDGFTRTELALSPDGRVLVWSASPDGSPASAVLYRRPLDRDEARSIPGADHANQPFFSPDGRWVGFYDSLRGKLRKIPVEGGLAVDLAESDSALDGPMGFCWTVDGNIVLGHQRRGLDWIPAEGGRPRALTTIDRAREIGHRLPWVLPGGKVIVFTAVPHGWGVRARVEAVSLASGARKVLVEDAADARYLPTGHLVFVRQGVLMAAPFDPVRLTLETPPVPVLDDVRQALNWGDSNGNSGAGQFAVSGAGLLAHATGGIFQDPPVEVILVDTAGRVQPLPGFDKPLTTGQVRFSPDGRQVAFTEKARSGLAWLFDVERQTHRPLSRDGIAGFPVWSPDGERIVMTWSTAGPLNLWSVRVEGGGGWERLTEGEHGDWPSCWTPDGRALVFVRSQQGQEDILLYRFEDRQVVPLLATKAIERFPEISPDGRWLAYVSNEAGRDEVLVTSFPDRRRTLVVSRGGARAPVWSRDGKTLFYLSSLDPVDDRQLLSVSVVRGEPLTLGRPAVLFRLPPGIRLNDPVRGYDVHPDGRRFLFARLKGSPAPPTPVTRLHLVHNWFAELERLCPTRR